MDWIKLALDLGFEAATELNAESLRAMPEVRAMCASDRCSVFGTRWACPPGCGSLENCRKRMESYATGVLVQTVGKIEDSFDAEGIAEANRIHGKRFRLLTRMVRAAQPDCLPLSAGTCTRCEVCTYPDKPCRFPKKMFSSMEAYGLLVSDVCKESGMPYYRGPGTITFTSCILLERKANERENNK